MNPPLRGYRRLSRVSVTAAAAAVLLLAGCTGAPPGAPAAPPTPGSITETAPAVTPPAPVKEKLTGEAELGGVLFRVESVQSVKVVTTVPGEGSGPALAFNVLIENKSGNPYRSFGLESSLTDSKGGAAGQSTSAPATPLPESVEPGASARAVLVFLVPENRRSPVTLRISLAAGQQAAEFEGNA